MLYIPVQDEAPPTHQLASDPPHPTEVRPFRPEAVPHEALQEVVLNSDQEDLAREDAIEYDEGESGVAVGYLSDTVAKGQHEVGPYS